jgi:hypothetical protein
MESFMPRPDNGIDIIFNIIFMDLSFINLPTSKPELLAIMNMAYKAGQESMGAKLTEHTKWTGESDMTYTPVKRYKFKQWITKLANQWSNAEE